MKSLREYFIGDYLRSEPNILRQASIKLVYNLISVCIISLAIFFLIYVSTGVHYQQVKSFVILIIFTSSLFYLKHKKSIRVVCHGLLIVSWLNNIFNVYLFDGYNSFMALITVCNIIFAFHTLGSRSGILYAAIHFVPLISYFVLRQFNLITPTEHPVQLLFSEMIVTLTLVTFIFVYLIFHYHNAYELAKASIEKSVEDLKRAKEMAEEMNRLKSNFLSSMSHEIRTPINGILGLSQVIDLESKDRDIIKYVELQQQSGQRLLNTITSILNLSRIEAERNELTLKIVNINQLVREIVRQLEPLAQNKSIHFVFQSGPDEIQSLSDETMLYQVVTNVVGNAIKFTEKGSVTVSTGYDSKNKHRVFIQVADTGVGIAEDFLPRIFNPFEQESSGRSRSHEGSGLGLSISKKYIELLGGEIRIASQKGMGSTFQIILPVYKSS
ncbi:MAG TPA: ATP-binding protein [Ohtaekwangia sp.]